jgi:hypothetical protein
VRVRRMEAERGRSCQRPLKPEIALRQATVSVGSRSSQRYLKNPRYLEDYARHWFKGAGRGVLRQYSFWVADA